MFLAEVSPNQFILPAVLLVLVVFLFVMNYLRSRKYKQNAQDTAEALKVGDKVVTRSGIFGKVIEIKETVSGKIATLETGTKVNKSYVSVDVSAIYGIADDTIVVYDAEGNLINSETKEVIIKAPEKVEEKPAEEIKEETKQEPAKEEKVTEKKKTTSTKKTSTKKVKEGEIAAKPETVSKKTGKEDVAVQEETIAVAEQKNEEPKKAGRKPKNSTEN